MPEVTVVVILQRTARLLCRGWCQVTSATTRGGGEVSIADPTAARFCLTGALQRAVWELSDPEEVREHDDPLSYWSLYARIREQIQRHSSYRCPHPVSSLVGWNDARGRTQAEVVALVERTIACLK